VIGRGMAALLGLVATSNQTRKYTTFSSLSVTTTVNASEAEGQIAAFPPKKNPRKNKTRGELFQQISDKVG
jgi:hypothetical protein